MYHKIEKFNSFTKNGSGGNPAGVVLLNNELSEEQMLQIAADLGFSETAFVMQSDCADFRLRFFTPAEEVDLCGHATIAAFYALWKQQVIKPGNYLQETKAGTMQVEVCEDGNVFMNQTKPCYLEKIDRSEIAGSLQISEEILGEFPVQVVSTGLRDVMVPIRSLKDLLAIQPDFKAVARVSEKYNLIGYHLFSTETIGKAIAHCRNLAPLYDIDEEAATGTSNGALACYLYKQRIIEQSKLKHLIFEQGYSMNQASEILVSLQVEEGRVREVKVGGEVSQYMR